MRQKLAKECLTILGWYNKLVSTIQRCEYSRVLPYVYTDKLHTKISVLGCGGNFRTWSPKEVLAS